MKNRSILVTQNFVVRNISRRFGNHVYLRN